MTTLRHTANLVLLAGVIAWIWLGDWRYGATGFIAWLALAMVAGAHERRTLHSSRAAVDIDHAPPGVVGLHVASGEDWQRVECARCEEVLHDGAQIVHSDIRAMAEAHVFTCPKQPTEPTT